MASGILRNVGHGTRQLAVCAQSPRIEIRIDNHVAAVRDTDTRRHVFEYVRNGLHRPPLVRRGSRAADGENVVCDDLQALAFPCNCCVRGHAGRRYVSLRKALGRELNACQWTAEVVRDHTDRCHLALRGKVCLTTANDARPQSPSSNARDPTASQQKNTPTQCRGEGGDRPHWHPHQATISDRCDATTTRHPSRRPRHDRTLNRFPTSTHDRRDKRSFTGGSSPGRLAPCDHHRLDDEHLDGDRQRGQRRDRGHDTTYPHTPHCRTVRSE
jgi:hypothetical protein